MNEFNKKTLKNGLTILHEKRKGKVVSVFSAVNYGSSYEPQKLKGIAHLLEHLVFKGTKKRSQKEISKSIENVGGKLNAFTAEEITAYYAVLPLKHFKIGAEITSELITSPTLPKKELKKEKKVVWEEAEMYHDNPLRGVFDDLKKNLFKPPFGTTPFGTKKSLFGITREDLVNTIKTKYSPPQTLFCVVGDINFSFVLDTAKKYFKEKKTRTKNHKKAEKTYKKTIELRKGLNQAHVCFGFHTPNTKDKLSYAPEIMSALLTGGMSSILWQEIREKRNLAYAIKGYLEQGSFFGYNAIYVGCDKKNIKKVLEVIKKEIKNLKNIKQGQLSEIKEQLIGKHEVGLELSENVAAELIDNEINTKAENFYKYPNKILKVTLKDLMKVIKLKNYASVIISPKK